VFVFELVLSFPAAAAAGPCAMNKANRRSTNTAGAFFDFLCITFISVMSFGLTEYLETNRKSINRAERRRLFPSLKLEDDRVL